MKILGICAYYHDSGAALLINGEIVAAAQEESFVCVTHTDWFPNHAISYCLKEAGIRLQDLDSIVFYEKPLDASEYVKKTDIKQFKQFNSIFKVAPSPLNEKFYLQASLKNKLAVLGSCKRFELPPLQFIGQHQSQAASAFFSSPFQRAAVICLNHNSEWATTSVWLGEDNQLTPQCQMGFPNSFKMLYSAFTYYTGLQVNLNEHRFRELADKGKPRYLKLFVDKLLDKKENGFFQVNTDYLNDTTQLKMINKNFDQMIEISCQFEANISQWEMDIAASIQKVTEQILLRLISTVDQQLGVDYLCLAGDFTHYQIKSFRTGSENNFRDIWIQPNTNYSIGAALAVWHQHYDKACLAS
jgi:carbamoyltransferase